jgi:hypothetical protein
MRPNYRFQGKNLSPEESAGARAEVDRFRAEALTPVEGETVKTEKQLEFIGQVNDWLEKEYAESGVDKKTRISPEQVHFLPAAVFKKEFPGHDNAYAICAENCGICINENEVTAGPASYQYIVHECLHAAGYRQYRCEKDKESGDNLLYTARSGYTAGSLPRDYSIFRGYNEGIVDKMTAEYITDNRKELAEKFGFRGGEGDLPGRFYRSYMDIVEIIINRLARHGGKSPQEVWQNIKHGFFSGKTTHWREITKIFGTDALNVLAQLGAAQIDEEENKITSDDNVTRLAYTFFTAKDAAERKKTADKILLRKT